MSNPEALAQLARLMGREEFRQGMGIEGGEIPVLLGASGLQRLHELLDGRVDALVRGLLEEAMASDDVQDAAGALVYLDDRLRFLGELLTEPQRERTREGFLRAIGSWA